VLEYVGDDVLPFILFLLFV